MNAVEGSKGVKSASGSEVSGFGRSGRREGLVGETVAKRGSSARVYIKVSARLPHIGFQPKSVEGDWTRTDLVFGLFKSRLEIILRLPNPR